MTYVYSAQNHDWDLTLHASAELLAIGEQLDKTATSGTLSKGFSCLTGSMLLAFCAIESFSASIAFSMRGHDEFREFNFEKYKRSRTFQIRIEMLCSALSIEADFSQGVFQKIAQMQQWRNLVTHSSPYEIQATSISDTLHDPIRLHLPFRTMEYARFANVEDAKSFYSTAVSYIEVVRARSGINPRAGASYQVR
jgi:hypothetical protein